MNKIFKRTIATLLTVAAFATVGPVKYTSLFTKEANAAETKDENAVLTELKVKRGNSTAKLYKKKTFKKSYETDFESDRKEYYVDLGTKSKISIDAEVGSDYKVKLYKGGSEKELDDDISASKGKNTFYVKVYDKDGKNEVNKYTIYAYRDNDKDDDDDDDDDYDDIYLKKLKVGGKTVSLKESKTTYTVDIDSDTTSVKIVAEPDDDDYKVKIDGTTVDDDDDYEKKVTLNKGKNEIKIRVKDDDDERIYTVIINRGSSSDKEESKEDDKNNSNNNTNVAARPNQWVTVNGNLMYNDSLGNPIKNAWFIDRNTNAWYYFQADGTAKKGWFNNNGHWYYLNQYSGQMQTGWSYINGEWYCLNPQSGAMQTGWIKSDWSGDWYYCDGSGKMLRNTNVGGYRLASSGAWIR
ncbi:cell wall-binding protein [Clostridium botulinum]|uniref:N-acetylmuramoyl-L-alanine amidase family protein n=1 Tax=Clostridium botulinum TaxID=1491 RepID=UPI0013F0AE5A|nr:cadherin-like beta sandwich domain-containing protein [Clostridium botulinum]MBN1049885.1 cell wall-binding protein [Clostridium botulinum]NFH90279.1 cell wall-binding protein [Clostridium botulinum]NFI17270.1 cell wall-binding protein [Clostridium botulinum]NFI51537.1 cell wall-binding protein [Clostridium botulinum]NFL92410.1 cell wall-binding protein [Clostridium botulinum]